MLFSDPLKAVIVILLCVVVWFIQEDFSRRKKQFESFEAKLEYWEETFQKKLSETRTALRLHSEDLGKATKAVNGDMIQIKEHIFSLKETLIDQIEFLKSESAKLERQLILSVQKHELASEKFEQKLESVKNIKSELEETKGKIILIDTETKQAKVMLERHHEYFQKTAKALKAQKDELDAIKKKGGNGAV